ncbi:PEP-CTERM sorting domain-containing protein [Microseira wollei]|uniref:PEP-CTERM protein-sorting domain-containing protein n=1 Tax=Microseira wollei NIES-4236 TaxID=2530354 RepID=A0AAV3XIL2_9CYAN|nr:PEP-CTERM sorting domain-containing protein [Microseira wollei]GET41413.1 hypothetical protein MiSe_62250 [Microseira wollei NIES-4236]
MKLKQFAFVAGTALAMLVFTSGKSQAGTLIQNAELATPPSGATVIGECRDAGLCKPGDLLELNYRTTSSSVYAINDTAFDFTKFIYTILPGQDATWDPASTFGFFGTKEISSDGKVLTFSNGVFRAGATALFSAVNSGNTPVRTTATFEGTPAASVPEPTAVVGVLVAGALGTALKKKRVAAN